MHCLPRKKKKERNVNCETYIHNNVDPNGHIGCKIFLFLYLKKIIFYCFYLILYFIHHILISLYIKTILSLKNFQSLPLYSLSILLFQNLIPKMKLQKIFKPLTFSLYLALSNLIPKINVYSSILSLTSTYNCRFYFLTAALLSPTSSSNHRKSPPPLPILTTSRYSLFVGNFLILFSK